MDVLFGIPVAIGAVVGWVVGSTASTGVIIAIYRTGAEIKYGSFAAEEPSEAEQVRRAQQER